MIKIRRESTLMPRLEKQYALIVKHKWPVL